MTKLYKKSEFIFAVLWIIAYIVLSGFGDLLSRAAVVSKSITAVLHIAMLLILFFWIRKNDLKRRKKSTNIMSILIILFNIKLGHRFWFIWRWRIKKT